jgi:hypothetical protein
MRSCQVPVTKPNDALANLDGVDARSECLHDTDTLRARQAHIACCVPNQRADQADQSRSSVGTYTVIRQVNEDRVRS